MAFIQGRRILLQKGGSVSNYGMSGGKLCSAFAGIMVKIISMWMAFDAQMILITKNTM